MINFKASCLVLTMLSSPALSFAQAVTVQNDTVRQDSEAVVSCGFCASEKFGALFYAPMLNANLFPLDLTKVFIALAGVRVTLDLATFSYACEGVMSSGGMPTQISAQYEVYAGVTPPTTISGLPAMGVWPGETILMPLSTTMITLSEPQANGQWQLNFQEIQLNGVTVAPPNTYIRVVVTIPIGTNQHDACSNPLINLSPPGGVAFRDTDITGSSRRNFIYAAATLGSTAGWIYNEDFSSAASNNINGDWLIRLEVQPHSGLRPPPRDASVLYPDAEPPDAGFEMDAAVFEDAAAVFPDASPAQDAAASPDVGAVPDTGDNRPSELDAMVSEDAGPANQARDSGVTTVPAPGRQSEDSCGCQTSAPINDQGIGFAIFALMALIMGVRRRRIS